MRRIPTLFRLARRGVLREARRSLLTSSAMALGLALLMFSRSLADGGHEDWINTGVRMGSGHVLFQAPGFRESRSLDDRLSESEASAALAALDALEHTLLLNSTDVLGTATGILVPEGWRELDDPGLDRGRRGPLYVGGIASTASA